MLLIVAKIRIRHTIQGASDAKAFFPYIHENTPIKIPSKRHLAHHRIIAPDAPSTRPQSGASRARDAKPAVVRAPISSFIHRSLARIDRSFARVDARDRSDRAVERAAGPGENPRWIGFDRPRASRARYGTARDRSIDACRFDRPSRARAPSRDDANAEMDVDIDADRSKSIVRADKEKMTSKVMRRSTSASASRA